MDEGQRSLLRRTVARDCSSDEFELFVMQCERTGLDPSSRQIYLIERSAKDANGNWIKKYDIQISIDGYRLVAQRSGEYEGQSGPFWCGTDGQWVDVWLNAYPPSAAKVGVWRRGFREPVWGVAKYEEYAQLKKDGKPNTMWAKMPANQLAKCAESLALRKAYPQELSGLYTDVEMEQAQDVAVETPTIQAIVDSGLTSVDDIERIEAGGPADEPHWTETQNWKTFYVYCTKNLGLTHDEVHEALEVDSAKKFAGTKEEAFNALKAYAASKAEAASTATDTETEETHDGQIDLEEFFASDDAPDSGKNAVDAISR